MNKRYFNQITKHFTPDVVPDVVHTPDHQEPEQSRFPQNTMNHIRSVVSNFISKKD